MSRNKKQTGGVGVAHEESPKKGGGCLKIFAWLLVGLVLLIILAVALSGGEDSSSAEAPEGSGNANATASQEPSSAEDDATGDADDDPVGESGETGEAATEDVADVPTDGMTSAQSNAVRAAENYLSFSAFSRQGLIDQLSSEYGDQFSIEDATFAVDAVEASVDWNEQAARAAENYLDVTPFSRQGLIDQLSSEYGDQYTPEQATSGVEAIEGEVDWNEQAARAAKNYLEVSAFSRQGLIDQLSSEYGDQYTVEQATAGVDAAGL